MKNSFKKIIGISLLAFGLVTYGANFSDTEIRSQFKDLPHICRKSIFDRLLHQGNVLLLGQDLIKDFLEKLSYEEKSQKALLLCERLFSEMPVDLIIKCIFYLRRVEDRANYSKKLLTERSLDSNVFQVLYYLSQEEQQNSITKIFEQYFDSSSLDNQGFLSKQFPDLLSYFSVDSEEWKGFVSKCLEKTLSTHDIYGLLNLLDNLPSKDKNLLLVYLLEKRFNEMSFLLLALLFERLEPSYRITYAEKILLSKKFEIDDYQSFSFNLLEIILDSIIPVDSDRDVFLEQFIEKHFNELNTGLLLCILFYINFEKKIMFLNRMIDSKKLVIEGEINPLLQRIFDLGTFLPNHLLLSNLAIKLLDQFFESSSAFTIAFLLGHVFERKDLSKKSCSETGNEEVRKKCFQRLLSSGKLEVEIKLKDTLERLEKNEQVFVASNLLSKKDSVSYGQAMMLAGFLQKGEKEAWLKENNVFWRSWVSGDPKAVGPLFSKDFLSLNDKSIFNYVLENPLLIGEKIPHIKVMISNVARFTEEQYRQGKIVFFHGQHDQWAFLAGIFNDLISIKDGQSVPEDFVRLRFQERPVIESDDEVRTTREQGIPDRQTFKDIWFHLLFTNLHLFANREGSNTLFYFLQNYDQTIKDQRFDFDEGIKKLFSELDMLSEYDALIKKSPTVFADLYGAYKKDVVARGNIGRLIAISMPKGVAKQLAYSTTSGGPHKHIYIDGKKTVDVVDIADNYGQAPFLNEYCVIMSKEMTDPYNALQAGIKMASFVADSNEKSLPLAYEFQEKRTAFKSSVTGLYLQRKEAIRRFREICPYALGHNPFAVVAFGRSVASQQVQQDAQQRGDYTLVD